MKKENFLFCFKFVSSSNSKPFKTASIARTYLLAFPQNKTNAHAKILPTSMAINLTTSATVISCGDDRKTFVLFSLGVRINSGLSTELQSENMSNSVEKTDCHIFHILFNIQFFVSENN